MTEEKKSWIKEYWRPAIAWQYALVCLFDFMIAPLLTMVLPKILGIPYMPWVPITLREGSFYHVSMMAVVGVSSASRGLEKIQSIINTPDNNKK